MFRSQLKLHRFRYYGKQETQQILISALAFQQLRNCLAVYVLPAQRIVDSILPQIAFT
ncbi:hypothetical protein BIW11_02500 [Tropilaelaps mercedesae]|uniref:Uncharacterized protein n=1 Tax=Tropilaelaps mercedesae TaxID=418985 RepID=A0A1V9Y246_9ACAR|nr:hypothetical protein BIW11_02500 [Tropilaelaps mercedesae]